MLSALAGLGSDWLPMASIENHFLAFGADGSTWHLISFNGHSFLNGSNPSAQVHLCGCSLALVTARGWHCSEITSQGQGKNPLLGPCAQFHGLLPAWGFQFHSMSYYSPITVKMNRVRFLPSLAKHSSSVLSKLKV